MKYQAAMPIFPLHSTLDQRQAIELMQLADQQYQQQIHTVAQTILQDQDKIVLLAGPSGSGKTTTARMICHTLQQQGKDVHLISLDDFYLSHDQFPRWEDGHDNYETVEALNLPLFNQVMQQLTLTGQAVFPRFDFTAKAPVLDGERICYTDDTVLLIEGIHALNPLLQQSLPSSDYFRIYVSVHADFAGNDLFLRGQHLRFLRRLIRDQWDRNTDVNRTLTLWGYVLRGEVDYIHPFRHTAEAHINSAHSYEPYLYAKLGLEALHPLPADHPQAQMVQKLLEVLPNLPTLSPDAIAKTALMQEFVGGLVHPQA